MSQWLAILLFVIQQAQALPEVKTELDLRQGDQVHSLVPRAWRVSFSDPQTPSCQVLRFRIRQWLTDLDEIDRMLRLIGSKRKLSPGNLRELEGLQARRLNVQRELSSQYMNIETLFAWPDETQVPWVVQRRYRLNLSWPALEWRGFDATEPNRFAVQIKSDGILVQAQLLAADVCRDGVTKLHIDFDAL